MARGRATARGRGRKAPARDAPPDVFRDMLGELGASATTPAQTDEIRPIKRRKVGGRAGTAKPPAPTVVPTVVPPSSRPKKASQVPEPQRETSPESELQEIDFNPQSSGASDVSEQEDDDDEDEEDEFEDVGLGQDFISQTKTRAEDGGSQDHEDGALNLVLEHGKAPESASSRKRRAVTSISDKQMCLQVHKLHLLCLLSHVSLRNHWCNDDRVQRALRKIVPRRAREEMEDDPTEDQYTRDQKLRSGLRVAMQSFEERFTVNARGIVRAWWDAPENQTSPPSFDDLDVITSRGDFRSAASTASGSRDVGAQLFCAMLRGLGLEVRLVCSLQALPVNGNVRPIAPNHPAPAHIVPFEDTRTGVAAATALRSSENNVETRGDRDQDEAYAISNIKRRLHGSLGSSGASVSRSVDSPARLENFLSPKRFRESSCPVYWVEVFTPAYQKWIPADALVTESLGRPGKLEPAQKDIRNSMAYVVALEDDGSMRDVTRRYAAQFNAKTRKLRLDTKVGSDGSQWWQKVTRIYQHPVKLARDDIEDAEMLRREEREGMPRNVEDFKGHPLYVLERHLRRNEVIHPRREIGRTGAGKSGDEAVFRRRDVHTVKSADAWYRLGREIKIGEQPLKQAVPRRKMRVASDDDDEEDDTKGLYATFQTVLYRAPEVKNGLVPRNAYGNLDVYVSSMIPPGAVHFLHPNTKHAARLLGVDFVDAVTGFEFKGRQGNAVVRGAIVATEYKDAVLEVLGAMEYEKANVKAEKLRREALRLWRRFLVGLRIQERVSGYAKEDEYEDDDSDDGSEYDARDAMNDDEDAVIDGESGGGFFAEAGPGESGGAAALAQMLPLIPAIDEADEDFTVIEGPRIVQPQVTLEAASAASETAIQPEASEALPGGFVVEEGGGFISEEANPPMPSDDLGGGFIVDDEPAESLHQRQPAQNAHDLEPAQTGEDPGKSVSADDVQAVAERPKIDQCVSVIDQGTSRPAAPRREGSDSAEEDRGSLLSEDPEDMDAEPDWLA